MLNPRLKALVRRIDDLPTLPRTVFRITEMINNPRSSARDLAQVITDDSLRSDLAARGIQQAGKLTWQRCAEETMKVYCAVMEGS